MSVAANKEIVRRLLEEGFDRGRVDVVDELVAADFVDHSGPPDFPSTGPEAVKRLITLFRTAFPDLRTGIDDMIAEDDRVVVRGTFSGTHQGDFFGAPASQRSFTMTAIDIMRVVDGKVAEHWGNEDDLGMLQQLGITSGFG